MRHLLFSAQLWIALLISAGLMVAAACDGDDSSPPPATATVAAAASPTSPPDATDPTPTPGTPDFEGGRDPVERSAEPGQDAGILVDIRAAAHDGFDRVVFEFDTAVPGYRIEYVAAPLVACGSGLPVEVAADAFLQIRTFPATAHDDTGAPTFTVPEPSPDLVTIVVLESTCDFEGEVTWIAGLSQEVDFNVSELTAPFRIVIDMEHP